MSVAMRQFGTAVASFQEVDINTTSAVSYANEWKAKGCSITYSVPEQGRLHRVALVTNLAMTQVKMPLTIAGPRCAAGLVAWPCGKVHHHILVVSFYGFADNPQRTYQAFDELHTACMAFGGHFLILGDFNITQEEGPVSVAIATGQMRAADEAATAPLPATSPGDIRRIDFGLCHPSLCALSVKTERRPGLSDHALVCYDFGPELYPPTWKVPKFFQAPIEPPTEDEQHKAIQGCELEFQELVQAQRTDEAWVLLSNLAEDLLGIHPIRPRRSDMWEPERQACRMARPTKRGHESPALQALCRLSQRLNQLWQQPWRQDLRNAATKSITRVRAMVPELPFIDFDDLATAGAGVQQLEQQYRQQEKQVRIEQWRASVRDTITSATSWVKRRAEFTMRLAPTVDPVATPVKYVHPAAKVKEQGAKWTHKWQHPARKPDLAAFDAILARMPSCAPCNICMTLTGDELKQAMKKMSRKAPGPDQWRASELVQLPPAWWHMFATLWNGILECGAIPPQWRRSSIVLLDKKVNETRPIALVSVAWRAGARALVRRLRPWIRVWCSHRASGGAPGRSAADFHKRIFDTWSVGTKTFVQQDLHAYFDSISSQIICRTLQKLGAPPQVIALVDEFYSAQERLFTAGGVTDSEWRYAKHGLLQGCPLSPILSLGLGYLWTEHVTGPHVECGIFVDDRCLWSPGDQATHAETRQALERSDEFDRAAGLTCRAKKCCLVTVSPNGPWHAVTSNRGYERASSLDFLGIRLSPESGQAGLLKLSLEKLQVRARLAANTGFSLGVKACLLKSLIFPAMFWAAGVALPDLSSLGKVAKSVRFAFQKSLTQEAPRILVGQVLGWELDVHWLSDWSALRALERSFTNVAELPESLTRAEIQAGRCNGLPAANQTLRRLGWLLNPQARTIARRDDYGQTRVYHLGDDSPKVLHSWLVDHHKLQATFECGRIAKSLHRPDPSLAVGFSLPIPARGTRFAFVGHLDVYRKGTQADRRAALATAGQAWFHAARLRLTNEVACMCGKMWPSRAHLLWTCPALQEVRPVMPAPIDRVEERLCGAPLREFPPAPQVVMRSGRSLSSTLQQAIAESPDAITLATDGSSRFDIGSYAIVSEKPPFCYADADEQEDQSPFRMELLALVMLFETLVNCDPLPRLVTVFVDCESALKALAAPGRCGIPLLAQRASDAIKGIRQHNTRVSMHWVPSHGKRPGWCAPAGYAADECRRLNDKADDAARRHCEQRCRGADRQVWAGQLEAAKAREVQVVRFSSLAGTRLEMHLQCTAPANDAE